MRKTQDPRAPFPVIVADPPWMYDDRGSRMAPSYAGPGRAYAHYEPQPLPRIIAMGNLVKLLAAPDSFLFLWTTNSMLPDALRVMTAWGFAYKGLITWRKIDKKGKPRIGGGHYVRNCTEHMLLGRRGRAKRRDAGVPNVFDGRLTGHSRKPDESYRLIERFARGPYLELYARRAWSDEWAVWGDQLERSAA